MRERHKRHIVFDPSLGSCDQAMTPPLWICTALNTIAVVVWALLLLERMSWGRSPIADYGSALGPAVLFSSCRSPGLGRGTCDDGGRSP